MPDTITSRWQDAEGWPTTAYFDAVDKAFADAGIEVVDGTSDGRHDFTYRIGSPIPPGYAKFYVGWTVDEHCDPLSERGFTGHGWLWLGVEPEDEGGRALGHFDIDPLAEPEQVAEAVAAKLRGE